MPPKKKVKKTTPKTKTGILDKIKPPSNLIKAKFNIWSLSMGRDLRWSLTLKVQKILPKTYRDYSATLVFDEEPFQKQIDDVEMRIKEIEADNDLFKDMQKKDINFQKERIGAIMDERDAKKKECRTIEFALEVQRLKYSGSDTFLDVHLPDIVIPDINDRKGWFTYYRLELKPLEKSEPAVPAPTEV